MTLPPTGRFTVSAKLPAPDAVQVPPPAPTQVQVQVSAAGKVSATVAPVAVLGPALLAVMVYVTEPPAVAVATPSVLVIARSAFTATALFWKQTVTSLTAGVTAVSVVERSALYFRYRLPLNCARVAPLVVKNVAAVESGPTNVKGPVALLLAAIWNLRLVFAGLTVVQDNDGQVGVYPAAGLLSLSEDVRLPDVKPTCM